MYTHVIVLMGFTSSRCYGAKAGTYLSAVADSLWSDEGPGTVFSCFDDQNVCPY